MAAEALTDFEVLHPSPKARKAARVWMKLASDCGLSPEASTAVTAQLQAANRASPSGNELGMRLKSMELHGDELQVTVTVNTLPTVSAIAVKGIAHAH